MNNKVLIKLIIASTDQEIDCFIPINEKIYNIKRIFLKYTIDTNNIEHDVIDSFILLNVRTNVIYNNNDRVFNTDIRNGTELILFQNV